MLFPARQCRRMMRGDASYRERFCHQLRGQLGEPPVQMVAAHQTPGGLKAEPVGGRCVERTRGRIGASAGMGRQPPNPGCGMIPSGHHKPPAVEHSCARFSSRLLPSSSAASSLKSE